MLEVIVIEMRKRVGRNRDKLSRLKKERDILINAENKKAKHVLLPISDLCDIQIDNVSDKLKEVLIQIEHTEAIIERYETDIKALETGGKMSKESKQVLYRWYTRQRDTNQHLYNEMKHEVEGFIRAKENGLDKDGWYRSGNRSIRKSYFDEYMQNEGEFLNKTEKRLKKLKDIIECLDKL